MPTERGIPPGDQLLRLVSRAAGQATASLDPADIMRGAVDGLVRFLGARRADLWRLEGMSLHWAAGAGSDTPPPTRPTDLMGKVAKAGLTQQLTMADLDGADFAEWRKHLSVHGKGEMGVVALATSDFSLGCLTIVTETPTELQTYQDAVALFAEQVASALEKARLHRAAQRSAEQLEFQHRLLRDLADVRSIPGVANVLDRQLDIFDAGARAALVTVAENGRALAWNASDDQGVLLSRIEREEIMRKAADYFAVDLDTRGTVSAALRLNGEPPTALLVVGLLRSGKPLGALIAASTSTGPGVRSELAEFLVSAAAATTIGLENALVFQRESRRGERLSHATVLATRMSGATNEQELCDRLAGGVHALFSCAKVGVYSCTGEKLTMRSYAGSESVDFSELTLIEACAATGASRRAELYRRTGHALPLQGRDGLLGVLYAETDDTSPEPVDEADLSLLRSMAEQAAGTLAVIAAARTTEKSYKETIQALLSALEASDQYTADHANDVADWAVEVGRRLGLDGARLHDLELGAIFHDIGKIAIPNEILNKPGKLTDEEFAVMKTHTIVGEKIIAPIEFLKGVRPIVRHEHERWDGHGYPDGIAGEDIPLGSRIIFVCDAYHAITSDRPYRKAQSDEVAKRILLENAGSQFDPAVVSVFLEVLEDFRENVSETASPTRDDEEQRAA